MNTNDNLDSLSDAALSEAFAVEVADENPESLAFASSDGGKSGALFETSRYCQYEIPILRADVERFCREHPEYKVTQRDYFRTPFATSADAVLPFLNGRAYGVASGVHGCPEGMVALILYTGHIRTDHQAIAPTFARAACIALIRAKRAEKGQP